LIRVYATPTSGTAGYDEFTLNLTKDCRCNVVTRTSADIPDDAEKLILFTGVDDTYTAVFAFDMAACEPNMSYTLTTSASTGAVTKDESSKPTIVLTANADDANYDALDGTTTTVTITAADSASLQGTASDTFTITWKHTC